MLTEAMDECSVEAAEFVNDNEGITTDEYLDCYDDDDDDGDGDGGGGIDRPFESCLDMLGRISRAKALALSMVGNKAHQSTNSSSSHVRNDTNNSFVWADLVGVVLAANEGIVRCSEVCLVSS